AHQTDHRADAQVDAAGDDDQRHAQRQQAIKRRMPQHQHDGVCRSEVRGAEREKDHQYDEGNECASLEQDHAQRIVFDSLAGHCQSPPLSFLPVCRLAAEAFTRASSLISAPLRSAVTLPLDMTSTRSHTDMISLSSLPMKSTPMPCAAKPRMRLKMSVLAP